jgi:hypothetical protein
MPEAKNRRSVEGRVSATADSVHFTSEGNPQVTLQVRWYPGQQQWWIAALDENGRIVDSLMCIDSLEALTRLMETVELARQVRRVKRRQAAAS